MLPVLPWSLHLKGICYAVCYLFNKLKWFSRHLNSKNNATVLLFNPIFWHWNCFLLSVTNGWKRWTWVACGHGLKLEKRWAKFFKFSFGIPACIKITKKYLYRFFLYNKILFLLFLHHNFLGTFFVWYLPPPGKHKVMILEENWPN